MAELLHLALAAAAGALLGALYLGGLWATVRRLPRASHPAALVFGSFLGRTVLAALGFALLLAGDPVRLVVALGGFLAVRVAMVRRLRPGAVPRGGEGG
jgi:F1F0 ATPase subunit 2